MKSIFLKHWPQCVRFFRIKLKSNYQALNPHLAVPNRKLKLSFWKTLRFGWAKAIIYSLKSNLHFSKFCVTTRIRDYSKNTLCLYLFDFQFVMVCVFWRTGRHYESNPDSYCPREKKPAKKSTKVCRKIFSFFVKKMYHPVFLIF